MNDERLMILQLLQEGKINKEEAEKLLDALVEGEQKVIGEERAFKVNLSKNKNDKEEDTSNEKRKSKSILSEIEDGLDIFSDYVNSKLNRITEDFSEEKVNSFNKKVNNNIERLINDFTKSTEEIGKGLFGRLENVMDSNKFKDFASNMGKYPYSREFVKVYNFENLNNIEIENYFGDIMVKAENRDDFNIKIRTRNDVECETLFTDELIDDLLKLKVTNAYHDDIDLEIILPTKAYNNIALSAQGKISIDDIETDEIRICSTNSDIAMMNLKADYCLNKVQNGNIVLDNVNCNLLEVSLSNGYVDMSKVYGDRYVINSTNSRVGISYARLGTIQVNNSNGRILLEKCSADFGELNTSNKKISIDTCSFKKLNAITSNGDIELDLLKDSSSYELDLFTSRGHIIREDNPEMEIIENTDDYGVRKFRGCIKTSSGSMLDKSDSVYIKAKTSNASIRTNI